MKAKDVEMIQMKKKLNWREVWKRRYEERVGKSLKGNLNSEDESENDA